MEGEVKRWRTKRGASTAFVLAQHQMANIAAPIARRQAMLWSFLATAGIGVVPPNFEQFTPEKRERQRNLCSLPYSYMLFRKGSWLNSLISQKPSKDRKQ